MCEKNRKVSAWLSAVFGDQPVPEFEVNTRTIALLHQLAESSEARSREASLLMDDLRQKAVEYQADGAYHQDLLFQAVGLSSGSVSKTTSELLSAVEGVATALRVRDTAFGSFVPAINKLTSELSEAEKKDRKLNRDLNTLRKKMASTLVLRKNLQEDVNKTRQTQEVERAKADERLLNMEFVKNKSRDLTYRNKKAEEQLASRQMSTSLSHKAILELSERVSTLKQELQPLTKKLEPYADLSPVSNFRDEPIQFSNTNTLYLDVGRRELGGRNTVV
uniref:HAUS augmin-like complex subunit 1 n=1 Tax=Denticeps clupeoides TaxID=299321 RepID=A0AAY4A547_9TELE